MVVRKTINISTFVGVVCPPRSDWAHRRTGQLATISLVYKPAHDCRNTLPPHFISLFADMSASMVSYSFLLTRLPEWSVIPGKLQVPSLIVFFIVKSCSKPISGQFRCYGRTFQRILDTVKMCNIAQLE